MKNKVSTKDLFGLFFVRKNNGIKKWDSYYNTIESLRSLFKSIQFEKTISGFYLNVAGNFDSVRISYFVDEKKSEKAVEMFKLFFRDNGISETKEHEIPHENVISEYYGGISYEEQFRNFLANETQIGLELLQNNIIHTKRLFATFRWQVRKACLPFEEHFEPSFNRYSSTYNSWNDREKIQFIKDLKEWPNRNQVDWAHLMVNFILGADWIRAIVHPNYITPGKPMSISFINRLLKQSGLEFSIPINWKPDSFENTNP